MNRISSLAHLTPISVLAVALLAPLQALSQEQPAANDPCAVQPDEQQQEGSETGEQLSETLDRCGSVLQPPATGDRDLVEPAPPVGETPVIPPGQLPADP